MPVGAQQQQIIYGEHAEGACIHTRVRVLKVYVHCIAIRTGIEERTDDGDHKVDTCNGVKTAMHRIAILF